MRDADPVLLPADPAVAADEADFETSGVFEVKVRFERGQAVNVTATSGLAAAEAEMARVPVTGRHFREFALGLTPTDATVTFGDEVWVRDGKLVVR